MRVAVELAQAAAVLGVAVTVGLVGAFVALLLIAGTGILG